MKKSKVFLAVGACALAITAVFATKANKKAVQIKTGYAPSNTAFYIKNASAWLTLSNTTIPAIVTITTGASGNVVFRTQLGTKSSGTLLYFQ